jgi:hypothetical protein
MRGRMGCGLLGVESMTDDVVLQSLLARQVVGWPSPTMTDAIQVLQGEVPRGGAT